MSDPTAPTTATSTTTAAAATAAAAVSSAGGTAGQAAAAGQAASSSGFSSMADLQRRNPELYNLMMQGIAYNVISDMKKGDDRIKKTRQEYDELNQNS